MQRLNEPEKAPVPLTGQAVPSVRKMVTILFADIVDSSRLSQTLDPEALRNLLERYFREVSSVIRSHGGIVEKYIGDSVMAVFGVPNLHEDDALRATRAGVEIRDRLGALNRELESAWGVRLANRIGINTGEVIAGDPALGHLFVTGDAVNAAKRLEEAANPNEILIGELTHRLVRHAVVGEPSGERPLRDGKTIHALAVKDVLSGASGLFRRFDQPFVNREDQRKILESAFAKAAGDRACQLVTVLGGAGVGKSRLVNEVSSGLPRDVMVLSGRCLAYGEGITYWPLAEIIRGLVRAEGRDPGELTAAVIAAWLEGEDQAEVISGRLAKALGFGDGQAVTGEEISWAVRRLFEVLARDRPLVIVLDDLQWAESAFLDLVEHVVGISRGVPILIVAVARPEFIDTRVGWGGGVAPVVLEPLGDAHCRELISNLLGQLPIAPAAEARIAGAAEGNPLFAEELVAMLVDDNLLTQAGDRWIAAADLSELPVPSTMHALLAARLDSLPAGERAILTFASVEGAVFHRDALNELVRPAQRAALADGLSALIHRDLIRLDDANFAGGEAYRFRHALIRDAAYRSLSKDVRAGLHERFATWLETTAGDRLREFEEIVGYHFEQAHDYRLALGSRDPRVATLAARAAVRLEAAGRRALARSDLPAAIGLLERVSKLLQASDPRRTPLLTELGAALTEAGRLTDAGHILAEASSQAAIANDQRSGAHALIEMQFLKLLQVEEGGMAEAARAVALAIPIFEAHQDHLGLCRARRLEALLHWNAARAEAAAEAWSSAAMHASLAGERRVYNNVLTWIASSLWFGPTPALEGIRRCDKMRDEVRGSPVSEAAILRHLGGLYAMTGKFDDARRLLAQSNATYAEFGFKLEAATSQNEAAVELLAGNPAAAEASLLTGYLALEEMGERMFRATSAALLARAVLDQGRDLEAENYASVSASLAEKDDLLTQILWRGVRARVLARRGEIVEAEGLAREAVALAEATDFLNHHADALIDLSLVLETAHREAEAASALSAALNLYERKGNTVGMSATKLRLCNFKKLCDS